jgi:hypothetical protein
LYPAPQIELPPRFRHARRMSDRQHITHLLVKLGQHLLPKGQDAHHPADLEPPDREGTEPSPDQRLGLVPQGCQIGLSPRLIGNPCNRRSVAAKPEARVCPVVEVQQVEVLEETPGILAHRRLQPITERDAQRDQPARQSAGTAATRTQNHDDALPFAHASSEPQHGAQASD